MSYKKHRCTECTLMRCDIPGTACEECMSNMGIAPAFSVMALDTASGGGGGGEVFHVWGWSPWPSNKP